MDSHAVRSYIGPGVSVRKASFEKERIWERRAGRDAVPKRRPPSI